MPHKAAGKGSRLANVAGVGNRHGQVTVRNRRGVNFDVVADDHRAGTRIDDDFCRRFTRLKFQVLDERHEAHALGNVLRGVNRDRDAILCTRIVRSQDLIDGVGEPFGGREIGAFQV